MRKRGQFYILGAFMIVIVISGLNYIYSSARGQGDRSIVYALADEAGYEAKQVVNNMLFNSNEGQINDRLKEMSGYYEGRYKDMKVVFVYGDKDGVKIIESSGINDCSLVGNNCKVTIDGDSKELKFSDFNSVYTIVRVVRDGEKIFLER